MGEAYVSRRGGGGNIDNAVGIYSGSTPPSSGYGVFGNTTASVTSKRIVPPNVNSAGTWNTNLLSYTKGTQAQCSDNASVIYILGLSGIFFKYSVSSNTWSDLATSLSSYSYYAGLTYNNGIVYRVNGCASASTNASQYGKVDSYSISSNTWTSIVSKSGERIGESKYYKDNIIVSVSGSSSFVVSKFSLSTGVITNLYSLSGDSSSSGGYDAFLSISGTNSYAFRWANYVDSRRYIITNLETSTSTRITTFGSENIISTSMFIIGRIMYITPLYSYSHNVYYQDISNPSGGFTLLGTLDFAINKGAVVIGNSAYCVNTSIGSSQSTTLAKFTQLGDSYPSGTLVVEAGGVKNFASIMIGNKTTVTIPVVNVYYSNGSALTVVGGKTRQSGGSWTDIS